MTPEMVVVAAVLPISVAAKRSDPDPGFDRDGVFLILDYEEKNSFCLC